MANVSFVVAGGKNTLVDWYEKQRRKFRAQGITVEAFAWRASIMLQSRRTSEVVISWTGLGGRSLITFQLFTEEIVTPSYKIGNKLSGKVCMALISSTLLFLEIHS